MLKRNSRHPKLLLETPSCPFYITKYVSSTSLLFPSVAITLGQVLLILPQLLSQFLAWTLASREHIIKVTVLLQNFQYTLLKGKTN